ncbi:MAG: hypothetical protein L0Z48_00600, partial [candidate division Zixibacteria bacterium]|nr:hypothetical protein [candidate division Zixibacteria bacterium]
LGGSGPGWQGQERTTMHVYRQYLGPRTNLYQHRRNLLLLAAAIIVGVILLAAGTAEAVCR